MNIEEWIAGEILAAGIKKGETHNQEWISPFIGGKWSYNYGIIVLHRVVYFNFPAAIKAELNNNWN